MHQHHQQQQQIETNLFPPCTSRWCSMFEGCHRKCHKACSCPCWGQGGLPRWQIMIKIPNYWPWNVPLIYYSFVKFCHWSRDDLIRFDPISAYLSSKNLAMSANPRRATVCRGVQSSRSGLEMSADNSLTRTWIMPRLWLMHDCENS